MLQLLADLRRSNGLPQLQRNSFQLLKCFHRQMEHVEAERTLTLGTLSRKCVVVEEVTKGHPAEPGPV